MTREQLAQKLQDISAHYHDGLITRKEYVKSYTAVRALIRATDNAS